MYKFISSKLDFYTETAFGLNDLISSSSTRSQLVLPYPLVKRVTPLHMVLRSREQWEMIRTTLGFMRPLVAYCSNQSLLIDRVSVREPDLEAVAKFYCTVAKDDAFDFLFNNFTSAIHACESLERLMITPAEEGDALIPIYEVSNKKGSTLSDDAMLVFGPLDAIPSDVSIASYLKKEIESRVTYFCKRLKVFFDEVLDNRVLLSTIIPTFWVHTEQGSRPAKIGESNQYVVDVRLNWRELYTNFLEVCMKFEREIDKEMFLAVLVPNNYIDYVYNVGLTISNYNKLFWSRVSVIDEEMSTTFLSHADVMMHVVQTQDQLNPQISISVINQFLENAKFCMSKEIQKDKFSDLFRKLSNLYSQQFNKLDPILQRVFKKEEALFRLNTIKRSLDNSNANFSAQVEKAISLSENMLATYELVFTPLQLLKLCLSMCELYVFRSTIDLTNRTLKNATNVLVKSHRTRESKVNQLLSTMSPGLTNDIKAQISLLTSAHGMLKKGMVFQEDINGENPINWDFVVPLDSLLYCITNWSLNSAYAKNNPELLYDIINITTLIPEMVSYSVNGSGAITLELDDELYTTEGFKSIFKNCKASIHYQGQLTASINSQLIITSFLVAYESRINIIKASLSPKSDDKQPISQKQIKAADKAMNALIKEEESLKQRLTKFAKRKGLPTQHILTKDMPVLKPEAPETRPTYDKRNMSESNAETESNLETVPPSVLNISTHKSYKIHYLKAIGFLRDMKYGDARRTFEAVLYAMPQAKNENDTEIYMYCLNQLPWLIYYEADCFFSLTPTSFKMLEYAMTTLKDSAEVLVTSNIPLVEGYLKLLTDLKCCLEESLLNLVTLKDLNKKMCLKFRQKRDFVRQQMGADWFKPKSEVSEAAIKLQALETIESGANAKQILACRVALTALQDVDQLKSLNEDTWETI